MNFEHIVFDCDGVLVDSEPLSMEVDHALLREHGVPLSRDEVIERFVGLTFGAMIEQIKRDFDIRLPDSLSAIKDQRLIALFELKLQPVDGAAAAIDAIDLPRSVASNSPRARVEAAFRIAGFTQQFGTRITTFEDVRSGKPAPDIYYEAARRANTEAQSCIVIEDSLAGVRSAAIAGCRVLGFTGTVHNVSAHGKALSEAGASFVFNHMTELPGLVDAIRSS